LLGKSVDVALELASFAFAAKLPEAITIAETGGRSLIDSVLCFSLLMSSTFSVLKSVYPLALNTRPKGVS